MVGGSCNGVPRINYQLCKASRAKVAGEMSAAQAGNTVEEGMQDTHDIAVQERFLFDSKPCLQHTKVCSALQCTQEHAGLSKVLCVAHQHIECSVIARPHGGVPAHLPSLSQEALRCVVSCAAALARCHRCLGR